MNIMCNLEKTKLDTEQHSQVNIKLSHPFVPFISANYADDNSIIALTIGNKSAWAVLCGLSNTLRRALLIANKQQFAYECTIILHFFCSFASLFIELKKKA